MNHFEGLMAAPFTPLNSNGDLALEVIPQYVEKLLADGVRGLFVCGSTGEGPNLTSEERMLTAAAFKEAAADRLKIFVHVGHASIAESQKLAQHAVKIGADAISAVSAFYFKPHSEGHLAECLADVAMAAPNLPFYYYHIPHLTGVKMDMMKFLRIGETKLPTLAGVKFTAPLLFEYQQCLNYLKNKYDMLFGIDEMLLPALAAGAKGMVGSTYNFAAPLYHDIIQSFNDLDSSRRKMLYLVEVVQVMLTYPPVSAQKTIMKRLGIDLGPCRLPLGTLTRTEEAELLKKLDDMRLFKMLSVASAHDVH
jgi:N-acetylneuraminate lyase